MNHTHLTLHNSHPCTNLSDGSSYALIHLIYFLLVPSRIDEKGSTFDIQAVEGSTVQLVCNATGIPPPTVQWFRHIPSATPEKAMKEGKGNLVLEYVLDLN